MERLPGLLEEDHSPLMDVSSWIPDSEGFFATSAEALDDFLSITEAGWQLDEVAESAAQPANDTMQLCIACKCLTWCSIGDVACVVQCSWP